MASSLKQKKRNKLSKALPFHARSEMSLLRTSLHCSTWEAVFATVHLALTQGIFLTNYVLDLGASNLLVGTLESLPYLLQFSYLLSPVLVRKYRSRRRVAVIFSVAHRLAWVPLIALLYVDWSDTVRHALLTLTLLGANACAVIATNAWFSWMTDLIPPTIRGAYYGRRNSYLGLTSLVALFVGSQVLSYCRSIGYGPLGYTLCFGVAVVSALFAGFMLRRQHEPEPVPPPRIKWGDLYRITKSRPLLLDYIRFFSIWQFSLGISAAYFGVYMVKGLNMSPALMGYQALIASFMSLLGSQVWGRARDRIGDRAILVCSGLVICLNVWIWLIPVKEFLMPVWVLSVFAGFGWAGFNMAAFSWPQELCGEEDRQYTFGVLGMLSGPAFVAGSLLGGALTTYLPEVLFHLGPLRFNSYMFVFVASAVGRNIALVLLCRWTRKRDPNLRGFWRCVWDSFEAMREKED